MDTAQVEKKTLDVLARLTRLVIAWVYIQTLLLGLGGWYVGYNVAFNGAWFSYTPPYEEVAPIVKHNHGK